MNKVANRVNSDRSKSDDSRDDSLKLAALVVNFLGVLWSISDAMNRNFRGI